MRIPFIVLIAFASAAGATSSASSPGGHWQLPLSMAGRYPVVEARVGAGDVHHRFIVDTAAGATVLDQALAHQLGLGDGESISVSGASGLSAARMTSAPVPLDLAGGPTVAVRAVLTDMSRFTTDGIAYDGILGNDVLRQFEVRFDVPAGALTMAMPGSEVSPREGMDCVPNLRDAAKGPGLAGFGFFDLSLRLPRSEGPNMTVRAVLDTGAAATVINPIAAAALGVAEGDSRLRPFEDGTKGFAGAPVGTRLLEVDGPSVAAWQWSPTTVRVSALPVFQALGLDQQPAAIVGIDLLRHMAVGFDAGLQSLCFSQTP